MRTVDLFAGFGGFTEGATQAGANVVWAANHWQTAVDVHSLNHPDTTHVCQDLMQANWAKLPEYDLLLASPSCQGHSNASQPRRTEKHEVMRTTAWAVVECAEVTKPKAIIVENVPEFLRWTLFETWLSALQKLGYFTSVQVLCASLCGVPQRRRRTIITASKSKAIKLVNTQTIEPAFSDCLEPCAGGWKDINEAGPDARQRMHKASSRLKGAPCIVQHVTHDSGMPITGPVRTITTARQHCLVEGSRYRWLTSREIARGMGFPDSYVWPSTLNKSEIQKGLGNAIPPPMARAAVEQMMAAS
jgi:DNA (cytosine-5)-methyltransferase 1